MFKSKKAKIALFSGLAALILAIVGGGLWLGMRGTGSSTETDGEVSYTYAVSAEGSIASTTLLAGTVSAAEEQYVYYDASKGDITEIKVKEGDQVTAGQALVQYDTTTLQADLDTAVRARDKIGRQIYQLRTTGQTVDLTGDDATDSSAIASAQTSVDNQLADLNDSYADAEAAVAKAQAALNEATVTSTAAGTVVEVNSSVSKSNTSTNQTVVHIVNQGSLEVTGNLSEYELANVQKDQEVIITSKVYPDKSWTGKITYISEYPADSSASAATSTGATTSSASYPFKVAITSDIAELKQGFNVSIEVVNQTSYVLVPVTAIVTEEDGDYVWTYDDNGKVAKVAVTLGSADATQQEITAGLEAGVHVISNPTSDLEDGKEVSAYEEETLD